ncbi:hypothetical protein ASPWEDRAFT_245001 [Aspergillus wentii DTO 134E9]|uniref:Uncharacterized protein n=1 Tax=Aspergillus wentii DTO 134E9 TaxID=1073089 RepID=A0A1L9S1R3_ASPWE|nr:uncharacterized protein ASPWEDRAFT_245001 [Aspergillus wentii DTO 134E9]OJJ41100.1 hypothetical protein ASPWEDRAFT_245001 [Aspergillus wentii DTO 134E9]
MGIVVSGEDGSVGISNEQQKIDLIAAENDYGLVMATLDQVTVFLGSWWTSSLTGRIQTFRRYTHAPLMNIISFERSSVGILGFYFAGIPTWAVSTCLSICRHHPLERLVCFLQNQLVDPSSDSLYSRIMQSFLFMFHSAARGTLLVVAVQTYMYSLLQSLHLVHPYAIPGAQLFIPFGELASVQLPPLPTDLSAGSLSTFALGLVKTPALLVYFYVYLRPILEIRLYRLIRRRLPKPSLADELSIRVAFENDLIDWMVPTLGRRSEEENRRNHLTFWEDVAYELSVFRGWVSSWFGSWSRQTDQSAAPPKEERIESLRHCIEELQSELGAAQSRTHLLQQQSNEPPRTPEQAPRGYDEGARTSSPGPTVSVQTPELGSVFNGDQLLSNEENRMSHSPDQMSGDYFSEMAPLGRARSAPSTGDASRPPTNQGPNRGEEVVGSRRNSRSNTLFSRPSSPETSPPTSPRVRASLIHQNSDIITMQLELLGNRNSQNQNQLNPRTGIENEGIRPTGSPTDRRRSITEFLDNILSNQGQNLSAIMNSDGIDSDGLSNLTTGATPVVGDSLAVSEIQSPHPNTVPEQPPVEPPSEAPVSNRANILPNGVEETSQEEAHDPAPEETIFDNHSELEQRPPTSNSHIPQQPTTNVPSLAHRVTILSSHPVDSLASHLASMITTVLFIPLESLYLRSLASSYLSSTGSSALLHSDVRGLGVWGGGGSRSDTLAYMGKLALMMGVQAAVNASVWGVISGTAIKIGRKFCGWGTL